MKEPLICIIKTYISGNVKLVDTLYGNKSESEILSRIKQHPELRRGNFWIVTIWKDGMAYLEYFAKYPKIIAGSADRILTSSDIEQMCEVLNIARKKAKEAMQDA